MTVSLETNKITYAGTGSAGPFSVPFKFYENDDLDVIRSDVNGTETLLQLDVGYTVLGAGLSSGGSVTLTTALATGEHLLIRRGAPILQEQNWTDLNEFTAASINDALDKLAMQIQQVNEKASRALQASAMSGVCDSTLTPCANYLLAWNASGNGWQNLPTTEISVPEIDHIGNYGNSLVEAVAAIGSTQKLLLINTEIETTEVTVPANITLWIPPGGKINTYFTVTILGQIMAGRYKIFNPWVSGRFVLSSAMDYVCPEWWWNGTDDFYAPILSAVICARAGGVPRVSIGAGTFECGASIPLRFGVTVEGMGEKTILKYIGAEPLFTAYEDLYSSSGYWCPLRNLVIDNAANVNDTDLIYLDRHLSMLTFEYIRFVGNPAAEQCAFHAYHTDPNSRANKIYFLDISHCYFSGFKSPNGSVFLEGDGSQSRRANQNVVSECKFEDYKVALKVGGVGNKVINCTFNPNDNPALLAGGGTNHRIVFYDGYANELSGNWFEDGADEILVKCDGNSTGTKRPPVNVSSYNPGLRYPNQIADLATATGSRYGHTAVYSSGTTLTVAGDVHATYPVESKVWVDCGDNGWRSARVSSVSYSSPNTTIVLDASVLTSNLETISPTYKRGFRPDVRGLYQAFSPDLTLGRLRFETEDTGRYITKIIKGRCKVDTGSIAAGGILDVTIPATGVKVGMVVFVNPRYFPTGVGILGAYPGADTITIRFFNYTSEAHNPQAQVYKWLAIQGVGDVLEEYNDTTSTDDAVDVDDTVNEDVLLGE